MGIGVGFEEFGKEKFFVDSLLFWGYNLCAVVTKFFSMCNLYFDVFLSCNCCFLDFSNFLCNLRQGGVLHDEAVVEMMFMLCAVNGVSVCGNTLRFFVF